MTNTSELADRMTAIITRFERWNQRTQRGVPLSQLSVLQRLARFGAMTMSQLAEHENISRPTTTNLVERLEQRALVIRLPGPNDGRTRVVSLTCKGRTILAERHEKAMDPLARRIDQLTLVEKRVLQDAITIIERIVASNGTTRNRQ